MPISETIEAPLSVPVHVLMRPVTVLPASASLLRAADVLRTVDYPLLPVSEEGRLIGAISNGQLAYALAQGTDPLEPVVSQPLMEPPLVFGSESGAAALRRFSLTGAAALFVVNPDGTVIGVVTPADLFPKLRSANRPSLVGGMATPFGVYLTTGSIGAGVGPYALAATGALMAVMLVLSTMATDSLVGFLVNRDIHNTVLLGIHNFLPLLLFLVGMRLIPLSGIHAAEHMTVHAIEREEPLELETVRRMSRIHPRCGTNLAVAAGIFFGVLSIEWIPTLELRMLVGLIVAATLRLPLGSLVQKW
ncbi:MAG TPA: DUF1385 domain-containing protein, partial [Fimbriimonadaceae bacterium]|nr:DUF1385 domain-containing protein [Fimbriimonadaceae bacterium]